MLVRNAYIYKMGENSDYSRSATVVLLCNVSGEPDEIAYLRNVYHDRSLTVATKESLSSQDSSSVFQRGVVDHAAGGRD